MASKQDVEYVEQQLECNHVEYEPEETEFGIDSDGNRRPTKLRCSNCDYIVARGYSACESLFKDWNETMIKRHQSKIDEIDSLKKGDKE
jgi:hypothetical protein